MRSPSTDLEEYFVACNMALIVANELISTSTLLLILFKKNSLLSLSLTLSVQYTIYELSQILRVWCAVSYR